MVFISRNAVPINIATWFLSILENAEIKNIVFVTLIFCILYCIKMFIVRLDMSTLFCKYSTSDQTGSATLKYSFLIRIRINVRRYGLMLVYYNTEYLWLRQLGSIRELFHHHWWRADFVIRLQGIWTLKLWHAAFNRKVAESIPRAPIIIQLLIFSIIKINKPEVNFALKLKFNSTN